MLANVAVAALLASHVAAFPFVADTVGMDGAAMKRSERLEMRQAGSASTCPNNPNHPGAIPISSKYPYCGAKGGVPGTQNCKNNMVPAPGDTAHYWQAPGPLDIRGPCPGLNTAANHGFLSRDGISNFTELIDAQQNVYGVGYDLAVLLAVFGVGLDGDPVTTKVSIGCDATSRTSAAGNGPEPGLDGHNKFEGDTSLTRNDYFLANGDNFKFNSTLFAMMSSVCKNNCSFDQISLYRYQRYQQSRSENGNFYFGPKSVLLYGAASFLYELFPSLGENGVPDQNTMNYFFVREQLPPNWYSRVDPYSIPLVAAQIFAQYQAYPVMFGGNTGKPNSFVGIGEDAPYFSNGLYNGTAAGVACLLYQIATENEPSSIQGLSTIPEANFKWAASQLNPLFEAGGVLGSLACPLNFNDA